MVQEEEEKGRGFKVDDRRRFSAEGELKPEHRGDESIKATASASPTARAETGGPQSSTEATMTPPSRQRDDQTSAATGEPSPSAEITFAGFVVGLSTQALVHLGEIEDPGEGGTINLPAAQQLIDIIGMLQDKTRGNLDKHEQDLLKSVLFELRMRYIERNRRA